MTLENKGTYHDKLTIYILPEKKEVVKKAKVLFKKDGSSISQWFIKELEAYVNLHWPGNPQLTFDVQGELFYPIKKHKPKVALERKVDPLVARATKAAFERRKREHSEEESFSPNLSCAKPYRKPNE